MSLIAWSQILLIGIHPDASSLNTFKCWRYSVGIFSNSSGNMVTPSFAGSSVVAVACPIVIYVMCRASCGGGRGVFLIRGTNLARAWSAVWNMMGNWVDSIQPLFQSIWGCTAANQGYPSMHLLSPRCERKNRKFVRCLPTCTPKSV